MVFSLHVWPRPWKLAKPCDKSVARLETGESAGRGRREGLTVVVMLVRVLVPAVGTFGKGPDAFTSLLPWWQLTWAVGSPSTCSRGKRVPESQAKVAASQGLLSMGIGGPGGLRGRPCVRTCSIQMIPSLVHLERGEKEKGGGKERGASQRGAMASQSRASAGLGTISMNLAL